MKQMWKKLMITLLAAAMLCTGIPCSAMAAGFSDVPADAWFAKSVEDLVNKGVISGTSPTTFSPGKSLTRGAFATMLAKSFLTEGELSEYNYTGKFKDVTPAHWSNRYVNWASENGIVNGYENGTFQPDRPISRQDMAVMVTGFARATLRSMVTVNSPAAFTDSSAISGYALSSIQVCQRAGIIGGYEDGSFQPKRIATRAEAASLYSGFLAKCTVNPNYILTRKRIANTSVKAIEFDATQYRAQFVMANDGVYGAESASSIISRTGASVAVNAAFFDLNSYAPAGTLIKDGRVITVADQYAPAKSAFAMDSNGNFSIENFTTKHTITLHKPDNTDSVLYGLVVNRRPSSEKDAARILFTRDWGSVLGFPARDAVVLAADGTVLEVHHSTDGVPESTEPQPSEPEAEEGGEGEKPEPPQPPFTDLSNLAIPSGGYVLAQRSRREYEGDFFDSCKVGDVLDIDLVYEGASTQDLDFSIGAGPKIVKNGVPCGSAASYAAEGYGSLAYGSALRVCIGIKPGGRIVLASAYATLDKMAEVMASMGCTDAVNFDGGGSSHIYVGGQWLVGPQNRLLNNMLVFVRK